MGLTIHALKAKRLLSQTNSSYFSVRLFLAKRAFHFIANLAANINYYHYSKTLITHFVDNKTLIILAD